MFGKKKTTREIDISKVLTCGIYTFILDKIVVKEDVIKLYVYTDGDLFLIYEDDRDELYKLPIEYVGLHDQELYLNGQLLELKKCLNVYQHETSLDKDFLQLVDDLELDWKSTGRQILTYSYTPSKNQVIDLVLKQKYQNTLIKIKRSLSHLVVDGQLFEEVMYDEDKTIKKLYLRHLSSRKLTLSPQAIERINQDKLNHSQGLLNTVETYHHLVLYLEVADEVQDVMVSVESDFDNTHMAFGGWPTYLDILANHKTHTIKVVELGLIPIDFKYIDIRVGSIITRSDCKTETKLLSAYKY